MLPPDTSSRRCVRSVTTSAFALVVSALSAASVAAGADTPGPSTTPQSDIGSSAGAPLEEIIVTAERRRERLQDVPISVNAFTATALDAAVITNTSDLDILTPGLDTGSEAG